MSERKNWWHEVQGSPIWDAARGTWAWLLLIAITQTLAATAVPGQVASDSQTPEQSDAEKLEPEQSDAEKLEPEQSVAEELAPDQPVVAEQAPEQHAEMQSEFRDLIVGLATDADSPLRDEAFGIVKRQAFVDGRFDKMIQGVMSADIGDASPGRRAYAVALMPFSTLSKKEQASLILDQLAREEPRFLLGSSDGSVGSLRDFVRDRPELRAMVDRLPELGEGLQSELLRRMNDGQVTGVNCAAAGFVRGESARMLVPVLLKAAGADRQVAIRRAALGSTDSIMTTWNRERAKMLEDTQRAQEKQSKYFTYAERIIGRYDKDKDGALVKEEWSTMLVSPVAADKDKNGRITIQEYADFMGERAKR